MEVKLPAYTMSLFKLPKEMTDEIEVMMNKFWWGLKKDGDSGIHWMSWRRLCVPKEDGGMGFRLMAEFNDALLAKQGWKLLTETDSLVYKVFKARYFPSGNFLQAGKGYRPSCIWSSIHGVQPLLAENCRSRVGDGSSILIWEDKWLPKAPYAVNSTRPSDMSPMWVSQLFEISNYKWDTNILQELFTMEEIEVIRQIPLPSARQPDTWIWIPHPKGIYTVKSGYKTGSTNKLERMGMYSNSAAKVHWRKLWSLHIQSKLKVFIWRCCRNVLPVRSRLRQKSVDCPEECVFCDEELETVLHLMKKCEFAIQAWYFSPFREFVSSTSISTFWDFLVKAMETMELDSLQHFVAMCWMIWRARNDRCWRDMVPRPEDISHKAALQLVEYYEASSQAGSNNNRQNEQHTTMVKWSPPANGLLKLNIDAAIFKTIKTMGAGAIIRDENGEVMASLSCSIAGEPSPLEAEAIALLHSLQWMRDILIQHVIVETDCLQLVHLLKSNTTPYRTELGRILDECKTLCHTVDVHDILHVRREGNKAAHCLAKLAEAHPTEAVWMEDFPTCITHIIDAEKPVYGLRL